jgi:hypothetical protein
MPKRPVGRGHRRIEHPHEEQMVHLGAILIRDQTEVEKITRLMKTQKLAISPA